MSNPYRVVCSTHDQPAWLRARLDYLGASESPGILCVDPGSWASRMVIFERHVSPYAEDTGENERAYWGLTHEPIMRKEFQKRTGMKCQAVNKLLASTRYPWMAASLDAYYWNEVGTRGALELKCTSTYESAWREGDIPEHVMVQIQHQLIVTGLPFAAVGVLFYGNEYHTVVDIPAMPELQDTIIKETKAFYDLILAGTPPEPDASDACRKALQRLYPETGGKSISLAGESWITLDMEREEVIARMKVDKDRRTEIENKLRYEIAENDTGVLGNGVEYAWKTRGKSRVLRRKAPK